MEFTSKTYRGKDYAEIFTALQFKNRTFSEPLVNVIDNVKSQLKLTSAKLELAVKPFASRPSASAEDGVKLKEYTLNVVPRMIYEEFQPHELLQSRFESSMKAGAANADSPEFEDLILNLYSEQISLALEKAFWQGDSQAQGLLDKIVADADSIKLTAATLNKSNLVAEMTKLYEATPGELINSGEGLIYADRTIQKLVVSANTSQTYRDIFVVNGGEHYFQDMKIVYVPLRANTMLTARPKDLILGTDLMSDVSAIVMGKVQANSPDKFLRLDFVMDSVCVNPAQTVIYTA